MDGEEGGRKGGGFVSFIFPFLLKMIIIEVIKSGEVPKENGTQMESAVSSSDLLLSCSMGRPKVS